MWSTHLRWAALCPTGWEIVFNGWIPAYYTTPPVVKETRKVHVQILKIVEEWFDRNSDALYIKKEEAVEYTVELQENDRYIALVAKPDLYVLWDASNESREMRTGAEEDYARLVNLVVEVTSRSLVHIPREWLTAEMLGFYIRNLRPTFTLLIQLETTTKMRIGILPLSTSALKDLERLLSRSPKRKPTLSLCYNCDLRAVCPNPLTETT